MANLATFSEPFGFYIKLIILHAYQQVIQRKFFCVGIVIICSKRNIILAFISVIIDIAHPPLYTSFSDLYYWFDEGKQISFGEWQKLAIARTFSKDADVIFLDEPNSALDAISDYEISQLYQKLFQDKMGIIIAHKFNNLINQVNNILVIENGRLAESGTHTELLHQGKIYYEMYQLQNKNSAVL